MVAAQTASRPAQPVRRSSDSDSDTVDFEDPLRQALQRLPVHHLINSLLHSAQISEAAQRPDPSDWEVELRYPSGYTERFLLERGQRKLTKGKKKVQTQKPIDDLVQTIMVLLHYVGSPEILQKSMSLRLRTSLQFDSLLAFQEALDVTNELVMGTATAFPKLPKELIHHFFDQLYNRAVNPYINGLKKGQAENVYGEVRPAFLSKIFKQFGLTKRSIYLDLGSGVGNTAMQAALETGCEAHGIEREHHPHLIGAFHLQQFHARCVLWGLNPGQVNLHFGDFLHSRLVDRLLQEADAVLINNVKFGPEVDDALYDLLAKRLKLGAQVFSLRPLKPIGRARMADETFQTESYRYEEDSVSWKHVSGEYYLTRKERHVSEPKNQSF